MTRRGRENPVVTWPLFWVTVGLGLVLNLPDQSNVNSIGDVAVNALVVVVAVVVMFGVMWVLEPVLMNGPAAQRTLRAFVLVLVGNLARASVLAALLQATGISDARWAFRLLTALLLYSPILTIVVGVITLLRQSAANRAGFEANAERLTREEHEAVERTAAFRARAVDGIRAMLTDRLSALRSGGDALLGAQLRADVEDVIRPLSHRMANDAVGDGAGADALLTPRVRWADMWRTGLLGRPIRPGITAAVIALGSLAALTRYSGSAAWGLTSALVVYLEVFALLWGLSRFLQGRLRAMPPARRAVAFTASVTACMLVPAATMVALLMASGSEAPWRPSIAFIIITPVLAWFVALDQGLRQQVAATGSEMMARTAQLRHAAATARSVAYHEERRLSRALHGPVQAAVTSAAMRVEAGDMAGAEQLLTDAIGHLDTGGDDQRGVARALDDIAAAWDGLCTVSVDVAPDAEEVIDADPPLASSVIDICTDACSNAVRHGDANHITVVARRSGDAVDLMVQDDGAPGEVAVLPGLGSATLDDVTLRWERRREGGSTVLRATLPCR